MTIFQKLTPRILLAIFIVLNLVIGLFIVDDFGMSIDEGLENKKASLALNIYASPSMPFSRQAYEDLGVDKYYGTSSIVLGQIGLALLSPYLDIHFSVIPHFLYFVFFQIGLAAFFFLAVRFIPEWYALLMTAVLGTQPLFFGHAFINPKDIPLLALFTATVTIGFYFVDQLSEVRHPVRTVHRSKREKFLTVVFLLILIFIIVSPNLPELSAQFISYAYQASETNLAHRIFKMFTTSGSLEGYMILGEYAVRHVYVWFSLFLGLTYLVVGYQVWRQKLFSGWMTFPLLLAGAVWGFTISTRVIALAAGGIVGLYALMTVGKKAIPYLVSYSFAAVVVSYVTWPFLWFYGFKGMWDALLVFSDYPWKGNVLFEGQIFTYDAIPPWYVPKTMLLQLTEPLIFLAITGLLLGLYKMVKGEIDWKKYSLLYAWFALPLIYTVISGSVSYNNFRQYLFIMPPIFIMAGFSLHAVLSRFKRKIWLGAATVLLLVPAIISLIQLHPYQYIYYNQFVGGVSGAYRQYDLDYWQTSMKEMAEYIDENISPGSNILVFRFSQYLEWQSENDFNIQNNGGMPAEDYYQFDYAAMSTAEFHDLRFLPQEEIIHQIEKDGGVLYVLKKIEVDNH